MIWTVCPSFLFDHEVDLRRGGGEHHNHDELRDSVAATGHEGSQAASAEPQGHHCDRVRDSSLALLHLPDSPGLQEAP